MKAAETLLLALVWTGVAGAANQASLGYTEDGTVLGPQDDTCYGDVIFNHDGSFENAYAWQYGGIAPPYYGAFGEGLVAGYPGSVYCVRIWATTLPGYFTGQRCDVYVWDGGVTHEPGAVLGMLANVVLDNVPNWPTVGENDVYINAGPVVGEFTVGYWGNWPEERLGYYVGADLNGFGGYPWTYVVSGIGYPTGWSDPYFVWGPTQSLGLGAAYGGCSPVESPTWGELKTLFR